MKRLLLAALLTAAFAAPASAFASACSTTNACEAGAQFADNNYGVYADIASGLEGTSNGSVYDTANELYVSKGAYAIYAGIAFGSPYSFGANNDFFVRSIGPSGTTTSWYGSANWQENTYYSASITANGGNSWTIRVGPFTKTIANNGIVDHATGLGVGFFQTDPCWGDVTDQTDLAYIDQTFGLIEGFPSNTLFHTATTGTGAYWNAAYYWVHDFTSSC